MSNGPLVELPDDALVVRGGENHAKNFVMGSGVSTDPAGKLDDVSVNSAPNLSVAELTAGNPKTGYPGIRNNQIGVSTIGKVRAAGGNVAPTPTRTNPHHATLSGLTAEAASRLFRPTIANPHHAKKS